MDFSDILINISPEALRLPVRFYYEKFRGRLDKEILQLEELVGRGACAIDIGANFGIYSYAFSQLFEVVEAFEPLSDCFETLEQHSRAHNINVHNVALANYSGTLDFYTPIIEGKANTGLSSLTKPVEKEYVCKPVSVRRLDSYNFTNVSAIKIDVEGHESKVLEGAKETILRDKPVIIIEIEQRHLKETPIHTIFDLIISLGYEGNFLSLDMLLLPLSNFSYQKHQEPFITALENYRYDEVDGYVNNFVFMPKS